MVRNHFRPELIRMRNTFFAEEIVLAQVFIDLEASEMDNPGITENVYTHYFKKCSKYFSPVEAQLERLPYKRPRVAKKLSEFRAKSLRVGATRVVNAIDNLEECVPRGDYLECKVAYRQMKREFEFIKNNLETYFELKYRFPKCEGW